MYIYDSESQSYSKKTYLDLFLENASTPKKRGIYFGETQENAIIKYNDENTSTKEKNELYEKTIGPAFRKIVGGVLEMPNFRHLGKLNREEVVDNTLFRLIEKIHKFKPGMIGKSGQPVKAYSYFSTVAKNFILEQKIRNEKILKNKADVESSIDLAILSEDTLEKMSNYNKVDVELDDYIVNFRNTKYIILTSILEIIYAEELLDENKQDKDLLKLGYCLKYLIEKWDKIEFSKKNEFMRILTLYTGLPQQRVSFLFKKFKLGSLKKIKPSLLNKNKKKDFIIEEDDEKDLLELIDVIIVAEDDEIIIDEIFEIEESELVVVEEEGIPDHYEINSMEEWDQINEKLANNKFKKDTNMKWPTKRQPQVL